MNEPTKTDNTAETAVMQLVQPLNKDSGVGAVFENRVDNAGVAAVIVQRQKTELRDKQDSAKLHLDNVLKPALDAANASVLAAYAKALTVLLPVARKMADSALAGLTVRPYSDVEIGLKVSGLSFTRTEEGGYVCNASSPVDSLDVYADVTVTWGGKLFSGSSPVYPFPDGVEHSHVVPGMRVNNSEKLTQSSVQMALARFALPQHVVEAREALNVAKTAYDEVAAYIMDVRKVLQNTGELHEQALANLAEMSLKQTTGGAALLESITNSVRMSLAPKVPAVLRIGSAKA